ncbi:hypothetical protein A3C89_01560 [Candidatus Kaiserbacteria bacterium RIFCSPHIGHO2_02_FULL_50_50]|uniref:Uncharacterized protein n=1 Tax=Candidatus Kaiserbacteria bacterium RIFCSPHIGHO2_02_FULL_50_50 TaxID=1798492 RepID=A0A1F6DCN5_9BACT|nr:MAG: hypothetical protein A3C89_01560 [Candidatus Kaiserbacteria bacterium RIFCSPHIGHO2_02_FULL_50_50]OGG88141.1 MAG: hypothetical protein A3G62_02595 [Candidatus Kaiserbacteria bacterium RIFCSPLOWO2_12_FULL_50_10]
MATSIVQLSRKDKTSIVQLLRAGRIDEIEKILISEPRNEEFKNALTTLVQCKFVLGCGVIPYVRNLVIIRAFAIANTFEEYQWLYEEAVGFLDHQEVALLRARERMRTLKQCHWVHSRENTCKLTLCSVEQVTRLCHTFQDCQWVFDRFQPAFGNAALKKALFLMNTLDECLWVYGRVSGMDKERTLAAIGERLKTLDDFVKVRASTDTMLDQLARRTMGGLLW